jgi:FkbM family methyltransferase
MYIGRSIQKYGEFSELEVKLFEQVCKKDFVVVEVGANIGTHTMALSQMVGLGGRVYAFEPQRIVFQTLCANMALNSITNVETFQMALSCENGSILIPDLAYDKEGNFGGIEIQKFRHGRAVPKVKLDDFLKLNRLDFLKIDVEGMEKDVLDGAQKSIKKLKPIMYIENDRKEKSKALIQKIRDLGYKIYAHNPALYNQDNFFKDSENIFSNIVSKNLLCIHRDKEVVVENFQAI